MTTSKSDFKPIKIFRKEAQLIPYKSLSSEARADILEAYRLQLYDDKKCFKCPTFIGGERGVPDDDTKTDQPKQKRAPVDLEALYAQGYTDPVEQAGGDPSTGNCAQCDNYYGTRKMAKTVVYGEKKYLSVPRSSVARLDAVLANHGYAGKRIDRFKEVNPLTKPIKMLLKPYPWQDEAATVFLERKRGMIEAPPRAGKTALGALVVRKLGLKSLIIASQREWLEQFEKTFVGNEATGDKAFTSLSPKRIGMCHTYEDFEKYDVCLATFALFMSSSPQYEPNPEHNEKKYALYKLYTKALRKADKYLKEIKSAPTKSKRDELKIAFGAQKELVKRYIKYRDYVIYGPYLVDPTTGAKIEGERIKTGMNLLKRIRHKFAFVCVDEAHGSSALETSRVLAQFSAEYVMGLSGTPTRKISSQDQVFRMLIGPVIYKAKVERMVPKISLLPTGYTSGVQMAKLKTQYSRMIGKLETDEKRNAVICSAIVKAVKVGHSVMVPMSRINAIDAFAKQLDRAMTAINPTESLVTVFHGKLHAKVRDANLAKIKSGEAKVIVGNIALLSTGLNIPRLTYLIERMTVTSNLPKCKQRVARILTPMEGKLQPVILMLLDNCPLQKVTAKKEFFEGILPDLKPKISKDNMAAFTMWATGSSSYNKPMPSKYAELQGTTSWGAPRDTSSSAKRSFSDEFYQFAGGQNAL